MDGLVEIDTAECRDLLETDTVGRVAFVTPRGPRIVPVNYALLQDSLEIRTTACSELATYGPDTEIAFEIDRFDNERKRGWSIVAHGLCARDGWHPTEQAPGPEPWAGGDKPVLLLLAWRELTGRRVGGEHWPHPVVSGRARGY